MWRHDGNRVIEVLLVHRPRYDDWSLPKGKLDPGETHRRAAIREVEEETGLRCKTHARLGDVRYVDRKGRPKRVRYWAMEPIDGEFSPNAEVDRVRWVPVHRVERLLTYHRELGVLRQLCELTLVG